MFYNTQGNYLKNNFVETFADTLPPTMPNTLSPTTPNTLPANTPTTNSCDNLIKKSYADFSEKYDLLKKDYEKQLDEQKKISDNTLTNFINEKESWNKKFKTMQTEQENLINEEKKKLNSLKTIFEQKIKSLNSSISDISISIKNIN